MSLQFQYIDDNGCWALAGTHGDTLSPLVNVSGSILNVSSGILNMSGSILNVRVVY